MKKLLYLLLLLPMGLFTSCHDENDLPSVDVTITYENAAEINGSLYVLNGSDLTIEGIDVEGLGGKQAALSGVTYVLDNHYLGFTMEAPFNAVINANYLPVGRHALSMSFDILQIDKSIASAEITTMVTVVDEFPEDVVAGTVTQQYKLNPTK